MALEQDQLDKAARSTHFYLSGMQDVVSFLAHVADRFDIRWPAPANPGNINYWADHGYAVHGGASVKMAFEPAFPKKRVISVKALNNFTRDAWGIPLPAFDVSQNPKACRSARAANPELQTKSQASATLATT